VESKAYSEKREVIHPDLRWFSTGKNNVLGMLDFNRNGEVGIRFKGAKKGGKKDWDGDRRRRAKKSFC